MSFWFPFGLSGHEIYRQVTEGQGTRSLDMGFEAAKLEAELEQERAIEIRRLAEDLGQEWQGQAAEAAVSVVRPFADSAKDRAVKLQTAYLLLDAQSNVFNHTKNAVVPVPAEPPKGNVVNDLIPWETDLDRHIKQYQRDAQHNIDIYSRFDDASLNSEQQVPRDYPSNTEWTGTISVSESQSSPGGGPKQSGPSSPQSGSSSWPNGGGPNPVGGPGQPNQPGSVSAPPQPAGFAEPPQGTNPSDAGPTEGAPPGTRPPIVGPPQPPAIQPPPGAVPPIGGWPPGTVPPDGRVPGSGPVGRAPGLGPDGGRGGSGAPGARGGAFGEPGAGGRPGAGAGGMAGEGATGQRGGGAGGAGGRGAGAAGGYGPMGAGRASGAEDHEHQRKYLIGPDPDDTFGTGELTAPPVIGAEEKE